MRELKFPRLVYNWISTAGVIISVISGSLVLLLMGISLFTRDSNPYFGVFMYMILPPFVLAGLALIPIGMYRTWKKWRREGIESYPKWPYIDLNKRSHRNATAIFFFGTIVFLAFGAVGSYEAFHYSESVNFCGKTCHTVMKPEFTAYQNSPHARVACVACHVGPGAGWYAKSKLAGAYQVYAVVADKYPRPIPTPIKNLRPAQETCEQCHWPDKFFGGQQKVFDNYMYDSTNYSWPINLLIKTGGGDPRTGQTAGIHWHMNIAVKVEYIARDEQRQDIPWVKITERKTGRSVVYQSKENPLSQEEISKAVPRVMDCMDCHNRPSHIYNSPDYAINMAIATGKIKSSLPYIKRIAVAAMSAQYDNDSTAREGIANYIIDFYHDSLSGVYDSRQGDVDAAVAAVQYTYSQNIFPEMKVRWTEYENNLGHFISKGCMRCHAGDHVSSDGEVITRECTACHTILSQGSGGRAQMASDQNGLEFVHPEESIGEAWKEMGCYDCHTGVQP
ncbi:Cytochrome c family protein [Candidatus Zixiibacteriota bacterium]|nr:Cytochrome c family protein [candidate division Zixibacteria bacterium]